MELVLFALLAAAIVAVVSVGFIRWLFRVNLMLACQMRMAGFRSYEELRSYARRMTGPGGEEEPPRAGG